MLRPLEVLLERSVSEEAEKLGGRKRAGAKADKPTTVRHSDQVCSLGPGSSPSPCPTMAAFYSRDNSLGRRHLRRWRVPPWDVIFYVFRVRSRCVGRY
jgi:hypothetical protein